MSHIHEKIDFTVGVFVVYKGRVLLRKHDKYDLWLCVGGHVELHEDPNEAALREVKEEVGLDVVLWNGNQRTTYSGGAPWYDRELIPPVGINRHVVGPAGHEHVDFKYFAVATSENVVPENKDDEWRWLKKSELGTIEILPNIRFWAEAALDTLAARNLGN
ncbi:MAG: NUDIX domain-containing protein [Candidatus Liptonbacteria bacterium]|nr:NUDIX domain-containing protein [Candidatus Liptonbacteria bacterium]